MKQHSSGSLVEQCRVLSLRLLHDNSTEQGILAAAPGARASVRGYDRVFARDAAICAIAMALCGDQAHWHTALASLRALARHQAPNGQIPKYVDAATGTADFWYLGCVDATLWWLVARHFVTQDRRGARFATESAAAAGRALRWLQCQEHPRILLLQQNEASDWADIMPRSGFVLYSNALWYYVKRLYRLPEAEGTRSHFNELFFPFRRNLAEYRRLRLLQHYVRRSARNRELYLSFVNLGFWGEEGDVFGNLLALLFGLADDERASRILRAIDAAQADIPYPVRVTCTPIDRDDPLWRAYMGRHRQNLEWQYHNAGIWPFVGGFWVMALCAQGRRRRAEEALARLAAANAVGDWAFIEWFHGRNGEPRGMPRQSWNAAAFLLACRAHEQRIF